MNITSSKNNVLQTCNSIHNYVIIAGYASIFDNIDRNKHVMLREAFTKHSSIQQNIPLLWQHDMKNPIGSLLHAKVDNIGLYVEGFITLKTDTGKSVYNLINDGIIDGLSVGLQVEKSFLDKHLNALVIQRAQLLEISIASVPVNPMCKILFHDVITDVV